MKLYHILLIQIVPLHKRLNCFISFPQINFSLRELCWMVLTLDRYLVKWLKWLPLVFIPAPPWKHLHQDLLPGECGHEFLPKI
jgi:hypothetical protein